MPHRSVKLSTFEAYLNETDETRPEVQDQIATRDARLAQFPFAVMLELSYPELDFSNRWCFEAFGPNHGQCDQMNSEYPACTIKEPHCHIGSWANHWFLKTGYDYGFNEWYFSRSPDHQRFLEFIPTINFGENYS
jgi:hypothetical protein